MTPDHRSADTLADVAASVEPSAPPRAEILDVPETVDDAPLRTPEADLPIAVPRPYLDDQYDYEHARARRRERARRAQRLARMRLYSYLMTLAACVFALMTFMYVVQGQGDGDATFLSLGAVFGALTALLLWGAVRVTHVGELE